MEITSQHSEGQRIRARIEVKKRLLLDRVTLHSGNVAERHSQFAIAIETYPANSALSATNQTTMPASNTPDALAFLPPEQPWSGVGIQYTRQWRAAFFGVSACSGTLNLGFSYGGIRSTHCSKKTRCTQLAPPLI